MKVFLVEIHIDILGSTQPGKYYFEEQDTASMFAAVLSTVAKQKAKKDSINLTKYRIPVMNNDQAIKQLSKMTTLAETEIKKFVISALATREKPDNTIN